MAHKTQPPLSWMHRKAGIKRKWTMPFQRIEWACEWASYRMSQWAFIDVLEYGGKLAILVTLLAYIFGVGERKRIAEDARKSRQYVAWQTINAAQGKPGNAGRSLALMDLNVDGVSLAGVDLSGGAIFEPPFILTNALLAKANFSGGSFNQPDFGKADLNTCNFKDVRVFDGAFRDANLKFAHFSDAIFIGCAFGEGQNAKIGTSPPSIPLENFRGASFTNSFFEQCSFVLSTFDGCWFTNTIFSQCNFLGASFNMVQWDGCQFWDCNLIGIDRKTISQMQTSEYPARVLLAQSVFTNITSHTEWLAWVRSNVPVAAESYYFKPFGFDDKAIFKRSR